MLPLPMEYTASVCELKTSTNRFIGAGNISTITDRYIKITNADGQLIPLKYESVVKVNVFNSRLGFRALSGSVYLSNAKFILLVDVESLTAGENRTFFRVDVNQRVVAYNQKQKEEEEYRNIPAAMVQNISLSGLLLCTKERYRVGDELYVDTQIFGVNTTLFCTVRRIEKYDDGSLKYGCEFFDCTERQKDLLCRFIMEQQRRAIQQSKQ